MIGSSTINAHSCRRFSSSNSSTSLIMNKFLIFAIAFCVLATQTDAQFYSPYGYYGYNGLGYASSYYPSTYGYANYYGGYGYPSYYGGYYGGYGSNKGSANSQQAQGPAPSLTNNNSQ
ncbi:unnamed protein product [Auanema sp. JU1783]|nr:unnamed protein product [Auanema sp. JU1783]